MGRAMLILVILLSTVFAGIALRMQTKLLDLPRVLRDDQIKRETENVSDYALRYAIAYAIPNIKDWVKKDFQSVVVTFDGTNTVNGNLITQPLFPVGNGMINRIEFHHIGGTFTGSNKEIRFQALTNVSGTLQSKNVVYPAELAFNYFKVATPECFYFEMNQAQFPGQADMNDTSGNEPPNNAYDFNGLHTFPTPGDGVAGWKCGFWHNDFDDAAYAPNDNLNHSMEVDTTFTLVCFAKPDIALKTRNFALVWLPSVLPQSTNLSAAPATAIWYDGGSGMLRFSVGLANGAPNSWLEVFFPFKEKLVATSTGTSGQGYRNYPWEFFALTFDHGVLKAYYNGIPIPSIYNNPVTGSGDRASLSQFGVSIGSRITKILGSPSNKFGGSTFDWNFNGVLDQVGMFNRALNDEEIWDFYVGTMIPAKVDYIRD